MKTCPDTADIRGYFELLGTSPGCSLDDLKQAHTKQVRMWHPDRHAPQDREEAGERLRLINEAFEYLRDHFAEFRPGSLSDSREERASSSTGQWQFDQEELAAIIEPGDKMMARLDRLDRKINNLESHRDSLEYGEENRSRRHLLYGRIDEINCELRDLYDRRNECLARFQAHCEDVREYFASAREILERQQAREVAAGLSPPNESPTAYFIRTYPHCAPLAGQIFPDKGPSEEVRPEPPEEPPAIFCSACGQAHPPESRFCLQCGNPLVTASGAGAGSAAPAPLPAPAAAAPPQPPPPAAAAHRAPPRQGSWTFGRVVKRGFIVIGALFLGFVGLVALVLTFAPKSREPVVAAPSQNTSAAASPVAPASRPVTPDQAKTAFLAGGWLLDFDPETPAALGPFEKQCESLALTCTYVYAGLKITERPGSRTIEVAASVWPVQFGLNVGAASDLVSKTLGTPVKTTVPCQIGDDPCLDVTSWLYDSTPSSGVAEDGRSRATVSFTIVADRVAAIRWDNLPLPPARRN